MKMGMCIRLMFVSMLGIFVILNIVPSGSVKGTGDPVDMGGYFETSGDWVVNGLSGTYIYTSTTIVVNGNLTVTAPWTLTLINVTLVMNITDYSGQYNITVESGAGMNIQAGSNITSSNTDNSHMFGFVVESGGSISMTDSELHECGWGSEETDYADGGLNIQGAGATITGNDISDNYFGVIFYGATASGATVSGNHFHNNTWATSILITTGPSGVTVTDNDINDNFNGIYVDGAATTNVDIMQNTIRRNSKAGIIVNGSNGIDVIQNVVEENSLYGILGDTTTNLLVDGNFVNDTWDGTPFPYEEGRGIQIDNSFGTVISNNHANYNAFAGIAAFGSVTNITFIDNFIGNTSHFGLADVADLSGEGWLENNYIDTAAFGLFVQESQGVRVTNNYITNCGGAGTWTNSGGINSYMSIDLYYENNVVRECSGGGTYSINGHYTTQTNGVTVEGDTYEFNEYNLHVGDLSSNILVKNSTITYGLGETTYDVIVADDTINEDDAYVTLLNTTFDETRVEVGGSDANLTVQWFLHVQVVDSGVGVDGADVYINDTFGNSDPAAGQPFTTSDGGRVKWIMVTEFIEDSTARTYYTPHDAWAFTSTKEGHVSPYIDHSMFLIIELNMPPVDYIFITDFPNGSALTTVILNVGEHVTAYASGYNVTSGYIGLVNVNWSQAPTLGSFDITTSTSTTFTAGFMGGSTIITGQNLALGVSDIFNININPPTVDYVLLTDSANGLELNSVTLSTGEQVTAYASSYNATSGFLGLLEVNWTQAPSLGSLDNLTGTSTTFTAGITGGLTTITGENISLGVSDIFEINVINATLDYIQIRNAPSNGGTVITSLTLNVGQSFTLWAAAYNNTAGYLGDFSLTTWTESSGGSIITVTSPGASTSVQAQMMGGFSTITADYSGIQNSTGITVNPPTIDFITITDNPNGTGFTTVTLPVGGQVTAYASGYNDTSGYIGLVEVDWSQSPSLGSFDNTTGTSTTFTTGPIGGLTTLTGSNASMGVSDTFDIDIIPPTVDYIILTNSPNGTILTTVALNVGESVIAFASGYNTTSGYVDLVEVNWSQSPPMGVFNITIGTSTTITAGLAGGTTTISGENTSIGLNDTFEIVINSPTADYIQIRTQPGGGGINLCDPANYQNYPVGASDVFFGAMYNVTAGYFADVPGDTIWTSSNTSIVTVTSPGSSSTITCDDLEWGGPVTITLTASGTVNTTEIIIIQPTVDYIQIRDEPDGLGDIVTTRTYNVWQVDVFYAAGYNDTAGYLGEVEAIWWSNDTAVGQVTSPGLWTNFTAQKVDEDSLCHVTAEFNGITDTTGALTVLAPRIDFITIVDAPNGGGEWVVSGTYNEGDEDVFWAAGFNLTADYVKDVEATWESNNTIVGKVTPGPGKSTNFTAGWRGGYCFITATYGDIVNHTGPLFVINVNQLPTARVDYYNGTGFEGGNYSFSTDITLRVTGRKENIITMELEEDGHVVEEVVVTRHSNQPDIGIISYDMDVHYVYEVVLRYNGHNGGSNPIIVTFEFLGNTYSIHLLFNSQHGEEQVARIKFNDVLQLVGTIFLDAYRSTDFEGYLVDYAWDFGDGEEGNGETLAHTYEENGIYTVTLTVTDDEGGNDTNTITVHVENIDNNDQVNAILGSNASQGYLNGSGQYVVILQCPADLMIENNEYQQIGLLQGSPINTLEESFMARSYSDIEVYFVPKDDMYIFKVTGTGIGYYDLSIIFVDNGFLKSIRFTNVTCTENTLDTYIIDFTESRITIVTNEENKVYSLEIMASKDNSPDRFILIDMGLDKDAEHIYVIRDWEKLSSGKPVTLFIDDDNDDVPDDEDAFTLDPAASADTDGDGNPDSWNRGKDEEDSTTGLVLDDDDGDGVLDENDLDPLDPDITTKGKDSPWYLWAILALVVVVVISVIIMMRMVRGKKKGK